MMKRRLSVFGKDLKDFFSPKRRASKQFRKESLQTQLSEAVKTELPSSPITSGGIANDANQSDVANDCKHLGIVGPPEAIPSEAREANNSTLQLDPAEASAKSSASPAPQALTPEETQTLRDDVYARFEGGEAPEDYTTGPARFVIAHDGVQEAVALLMTYSLSQAVSESVELQRAYASAENQGLDEREALNWLEDDVANQISKCEYLTAKAEGASSCNDQQEETPDSSPGQQQQLEVLELMLKDVQCRKNAVDVKLETQRRILLEAQTEISYQLEEAFVAALLIAPREAVEDGEAERLDFACEYEAFLQQLRGADALVEVDDIAPLDTSDDYLRAAPLSEEQQMEQDVSDNYHIAKRALEEASKVYQEKEVERRKAWTSELQEVPDQPEDLEAFRIDFDLRWVERGGQITRALIDAEATFKAAIARAREMNINLADDEITSMFAEDFDGALGYTLSEERDGVLSHEQSLMLSKWVEAPVTSRASATAAVELSLLPPNHTMPSSPTTADRTSLGEAWEAEEVDAEDSVSVAAQGQRRT